MRRDALDEADFSELVAGSERLSALIADGGRLLPDFGALVGDVFCGLVKLNVARVPTEELPRRARVRAAIVGEVIASEAFAEARVATRLRPAAAGTAALMIGQTLVARLRRGELLNAKELGALWELSGAEERRDDAVARIEAARALAEAHPEARDAVDGVRDEAADEAAEADAEADALAESLDEAMGGVPRDVWSALSDAAARAASRLEDAEMTRGAGLGEPAPGRGGDGGEVDALALQAELSGLAGMRRLMRLLGALRDEARAARRQRVPRAKTEVYGIAPGRDLARLLPSELVQLGHPLLRLDFRRRLVEDGLLVYHLRGDDPLGGGPAVFLLDVSGSMAGAKVVWAKAVVLTLADIARRERRRVTVICFTSGASRERFELATPRRGSPMLRFAPQEFMGLAKMGTGGGTDFWPPLSDALTIIEDEREFARADVVLVTDGEANLSAAQIDEARARAEGRSTRFLGVLIDVASHQAATLDRLCHQVVRVGELTSADARKVFRAF